MPLYAFKNAVATSIQVTLHCENCLAETPAVISPGFNRVHATRQPLELNFHSEEPGWAMVLDCFDTYSLCPACKEDD